MKLNKLALAMSALIGGMALTGCDLEGTDGADGTNGTDAVAQSITLDQQGRYLSGIFDESAAEIVTFDKETQQTFVVNANSGKVDVLNTQDPTSPTLVESLDIAADMQTAGDVADAGDVGAANSVTVHNGLMAVAIEADEKTDNGWIAFYKIEDLSYLASVQVGALPDMLTFTPDGNQVVAAIEGEPNDDYSVDPEGQVSVIDVTWDGSNLATNLTQVGFTDFNVGNSRNAELPEAKMVIDGYNATVAQSFEPEYITISEDSQTAFVTLQENNAVAVIDLANKTVERIIGLGFKDHSIPGNELDASQKDGVNIKNWPVMGMYMPDTIASMTFNGQTYLLTANEGDDRQDWLDNVTDQASCEASGYYFDASDNCIDAFSAKDYYDNDNVTLVDQEGNPFAATNGGFGEDNELYRLKFSYHTTVAKNGGTEFSKLYAYGGRSFSIYNAETGEQVFDSGSAFETLTAKKYAEDFNNDNAENAGDDRSDNKGPEPEALTVGKINGHTYAFIGLERMGGIMVYDVSNPFSPEFVQYVNNRDLTVNPDDNTDSNNDGIKEYTVDAGDLGPEGFKFVSAEDSPNGKAMLIVGSEVSGSTTFYEINVHSFSAE
ncbi:choice-of-anchor I family protein [Thiomicrorhabdus sp.]|uniref:choice-of-anchor I family protein n=1 Tax=Thiomicrorhabdus sp. TaxID=2039724 RepID=UPI0029C8241F|nr:choice-of-anchor I family protein [Thiomicrorhabdus sp.]